jgi:hypothetical protein
MEALIKLPYQNKSLLEEGGLLRIRSDVRLPFWMLKIAEGRSAMPCMEHLWWYGQCWHCITGHLRTRSNFRNEDILMRSSLLWNVMLRRLAVSYRRFGTTYRSHLQGSSCPKTAWRLKMGPTCCPETSVNSYKSTQRNIPEERSSHLPRGGSLKSRTVNAWILYPKIFICIGILAFSRGRMLRCL